ncbi:MAG TPA: hypothetical protein VEQ60_31945 [Longimicrobium sp.]|nr:hypothetical protein [Longimicrobium sp.]
MERLAGIAEDVRHTVHVSAGGSRTDHLVLFEIGGTRLSFRGNAPVAIKEGDDLVVVWEPGDKGFNTVLAFHNRTVDAHDHDVYAGGCTGCGCSVVVLVILALVIGWDAVVQRDWVLGVIAAVIAVVVIAAHLAGRINERTTADKLDEVNALLDEGSG